MIIASNLYYDLNLAMSRHFNYVIIGGGIAATSCAQELMKLIDKNKESIALISSSPILKEVLIVICRIIFPF